MAAEEPDAPAEPAEPTQSSEPEGGARAYFEAIEKAFIALRGTPLLLSPADWQVARTWHRRGIPLDVVEKVLEEVFEKRTARGAKSTVSSLRYCARAVERAFQEIADLTAAAARRPAEAFEVGPRLRALARALPAGLPGREALGARLEALEPAGESPAGSEAGEEALAVLDEEAVAAAEKALDGDARRALAAAVEEALEPLRSRLPAEQVRRARVRVRTQLLRERARLPVLSLFAPEAEPETD